MTVPHLNQPRRFLLVLVIVTLPDPCLIGPQEAAPHATKTKHEQE